MILTSNVAPIFLKQLTQTFDCFYIIIGSWSLFLLRTIVLVNVCIFDLNEISILDLYV